MHMWPSTMRVSECFSSPLSKISSSNANQSLPTYNPLNHVANKERSSLKFAKFIIHIITLILSAIIFWFFPILVTIKKLHFLIDPFALSSLCDLKNMFFKNLLKLKRM
ncbi:hypothetical protein RGQ29_028522 [Quercus rubra]|uniref:Uncharacterized protein n=1 Tax=Quercus rubra TaxID=3512 RepID=A0AAN7IM57_QUERU|nr:hypothetical protein RGQ29_028522 [Quercus rubra]